MSLPLAPPTPPPPPTNRTRKHCLQSVKAGRAADGPRAAPLRWQSRGWVRNVSGRVLSRPTDGSRAQPCCLAGWLIVYMCQRVKCPADQTMSPACLVKSRVRDRLGGRTDCKLADQALVSLGLRTKVEPRRNLDTWSGPLTRS